MTLRIRRLSPRSLFRAGTLVLALSLPVTAASSQSVVVSAGGTQFTLSGGVQLRASAGISRGASSDITRLGFGMRRIRFRTNATFGPKAGMFMQVDGAGGSLAVLDFWGSYQLSPQIRFRMGRMVSAQPRAHILTGMNQIDVADRAAVAERWAASTIGGDGRDFGVDLRYRTESIEAFLFLHNGDGSWSRSRGNYSEGISSGSATGGTNRSTFATTGSIAYTPAGLKGIEIGGFAGYNPASGPNTERNGVGREYLTYGLHAYYGADPGSQRFRVKVDAIGTTFEPLPGQDSQVSTGVAILLAGSPARGTEAFVRGEALESDLNGMDDADGFFTAGLTYSPSARRGDEFFRERLTLAWSRYSAGTRASKPEDMILLQLQLAF